MKKSDDYQTKIMSFFKENKELDAVISADSNSGIIAINTALHLGKIIPKDISVVGFASKSISNLAIPRLTTIRQHAKKIGASATQMLVERLKSGFANSKDAKTKIIKTSLVVADSTLNLVN